MSEINKWKTRRQRLLSILEDTVEINDLKALMTQMEYPNKKSLINDIAHIAKTIISEGRQIFVLPASCSACGYIFRQKGFELKIPSKCPKCKEQRIDWPSLKIK